MTALARARARARPGRGSLALPIRLVAFAALFGFAAGHWGTLVQDTPGGRIALVTGLATLAGLVLALVPRLRIEPRLRTTACVAVLALTAALALTAVGLPAKLLLPNHWDEFADGLGHALAAMNSVQWPYGGDDEWIRLTLLLVIPLVAVPTAVLGFWPAPERDASRMRFGALVLLLALYATAVTERGLEEPVLRGVILLALVAAWLWLPLLGRRDALAGALAVCACALLAIPLASSADGDRPWVDYDNWSLFSDSKGGTRFGWDHRYGPIDWPRDGTILLDVRSSSPHYWKAETLDRFDGLRWIHSDMNSNTRAGGELPQPFRRDYVEQIRFNVRRLRSELVVGAGTILAVDADKVTDGSADGTTRVMEEPLERGDSYDVTTYVPDPSARQMRAAPREFSPTLAAYTAFDLPTRGQSGLLPARTSPAARAGAPTPQSVYPRVPGVSLTGAQERRVLASPYAETYRLARRLTRGEPTTYDAVKSVQRYLEDNYAYSERPPSHRYPLAGFLFDDKIGYCQQFSGAMALLLRMNGIPARVAAGFSPGVFDRERRQYRVRDLDAHSWVEVWFSGIGWVPFDPTPPLAPAESQSNAQTASAARGAGQGREEGDTRELGASSNARGVGSEDSGGGGLGAWLWPILGFVSFGLVGTLAWLWLSGHPLLRRRTPADEATELREALARLGWGVPARTTLSELERALRRSAGPEAARYARLLRERRFGPPGGAGPTVRDRRALRRALTTGSGPLRRIRALVAIPPRRAF